MKAKERDLNDIENRYFDSRVILMQGIFPFIPYSLFGNFTLTILLSLVIATIYTFLVFSDDGSVWSEYELTYKWYSFKGMMILFWLPIYMLYIVYLFKG